MSLESPIAAGRRNTVPDGDLMYLSDLGNLSHSDIAEITGLHMDTVRKRLRKLGKGRKTQGVSRICTEQDGVRPCLIDKRIGELMKDGRSRFATDIERALKFRPGAADVALRRMVSAGHLRREIMVQNREKIEVFTK